MSKFLGLIVASFFALWSTRADAQEPRPVRHVGAELNPLATMVGRFGGQIQAGVLGPVSLVAGVSYVSFPTMFGTSRRYDGYNGRTVGQPSAHGWAFELGPRIHARLDKRGGNQPLFAPAKGFEVRRLEPSTGGGGGWRIYPLEELRQRSASETPYFVTVKDGVASELRVVPFIHP